MEFAERKMCRQLIAFLQVCVQPVCGKSGFRTAVADRQLEERMFAGARLKRCTGDGIRTGCQCSVDLKIKRCVLSGLKRRKFVAVSRLKGEAACSRRYVFDLCDNDTGCLGMEFIRNFADMITVIVFRASAFNQFPSCVCDAAGTGDVFQKTFDFHFAAASFFISSRIILEAIFPLLILQAMPSPTS